jgi:mRNA interferase RelE/StbE
MGKYKILFKKSAVGELEKIPKRDLSRIIGKIIDLEKDSRPKNSAKLSAMERYRLRQGDYRIVYSIDDARGIVEIFKIGHRREIYRAAKSR